MTPALAGKGAPAERTRITAAVLVSTPSFT